MMQIQRDRYDRMTDRERRAYRRMLRQRREAAKRILTLLATVCVVLAGALFCNAISTDASVGEDSYKYYTDITVAYGETLWDIADNYMDYDHYRTRNDYIAEVRSINHLDADGWINAGQLLIVPYYSGEFIK